jgi:hypothetical protein
MYGKDYYGSSAKGWEMFYPLGYQNRAAWYYRRFYKCEE